MHPATTTEFWLFGRITVLFAIATLLVLATRLPLMPSHLYSFDSVNLALALEEFDPTLNQPQPPGYPLFVAEARIFYRFTGSPEKTFAILKILISGLSVGMLYLLGRLMFSRWVGMTSATLLLVNPVFWRTGLVSSLRLHLALFSILTAYCCWRAGNGERRYFYWACLVLGIGGGFRPELPFVLLPLLAWTGWKSGDQQLLLRGLSLFGALTLAWITVLVLASGGVAPSIYAFTEYFNSQIPQSSPLFDATQPSWRLMAGRAIIWTALGSLPWLWTLPFGWLKRAGLPRWPRHLHFLAIWFLPPFLFSLFVHIGAPGHALASIPIVCLLGGFCLTAAEQVITLRWVPELEERGLVIWLALLANVFLFFGHFPLPQGPRLEVVRGVASIKDAFLGRTYETSHARVRWVDQTTVLGLQQITALSSVTDRPVFLLWAADGEPVWRKLSFYFPDVKVYVLEESGVHVWLENQLLEEYTASPTIRLSIPPKARLIWVAGSRSIESLGKVVPLQPAAPVYYTDMPPAAPSFIWRSIEFVPERALSSAHRP